MKRFVLTTDLKPGVVAEYRRYHQAVWPEVLASLKSVGVLDMQIYLLGQRLCMLLETVDDFDRDRDFARHAQSQPRCVEWERLMKDFQAPPPGAKPGQTWTEMERVFNFG